MTLEERLDSLAKLHTDCFAAGRGRWDFYRYLVEVYGRAQKCRAEKKASKQMQKIAKIKGIKLRSDSDIYRILIAATSKVDAKTQSMWARVLRKAAQQKISADQLVYRVKQAGGAAAFLK